MVKLIWRYHHRFTGFAKRKIGVDWAARIDPDDLLQEAYIDAFRLVEGFEYRDEDSFYHWVTRIIDHKFIDTVRHLRRKKRDVAREQVRRSGERHQSLFDMCMQQSMTPSRIVRREDAATAMVTCLAQLPEHYREIVQRLYLDEEPIDEIAKDMDKSPDAIRRAAGRAVEKLGELMGHASRYLSDG